MSLSDEYCEEKAGNRDGGALAQQRKLILGLMVWCTLLTLGLATSIIYFQFIPRASQDPAKNEDNNPHKSLQNFTSPVGNKKDTEDKLIAFQPKWDNRYWVETLRWGNGIIKSQSFISGDLQLTVQKDGQYFLYLQVTLDSGDTGQKYEVTVIGHKVSGHKDSIQLLSSHISNTNLSTGFMGKGIPLNKGAFITVTCKPKAYIKNDEKHTYLGVIKIG
ncbi:tumor necrosis factor ligand superfamily member 18 isoform X2 [Paramisgurnus dabryanus]|uniref:tumor necrosis factor ligand superfamily member 18 isoform X2 n=1 Tax=Paramisgurnus dabryanus TaxID=90735 RepID=UPI0031F3F471